MTFVTYASTCRLATDLISTAKKHSMKTIKIFIASSDELRYDRVILGNLVRRLDDIYEKWGIRIKIIEWEDLDAAFHDIRKQEEYNAHVRDSDMFVSLFYTKAGRYTVEEFDVAMEEYRIKKSPKVYVYCKTILGNRVASKELEEFKDRLCKELGHYWCSYDNEDALQLHFVLQLQLVESGERPTIEVDGGEVILDGFPIARMDNLHFAASNATYQRLVQELDSTLENMLVARREFEQKPYDEALSERFQALTDDYNHRKDELGKLQKALVQTASRIAEMEHECVNARGLRAIEAFAKGNLSLANEILDKVSAESEIHLQHLVSSLTLIHEDIDLLRLQARVLLSDFSISSEERREKVFASFSKARKLAELSGYDVGEYLSLLDEFGCFCDDYGDYATAFKVYNEYIDRCKHAFGQESDRLALGYISISFLHKYSGEYVKALEFQLRAQSIREKNGSKRLPATYMNTGWLYMMMEDYGQAESYYSKAERGMRGNSDYGELDWIDYYGKTGVLFICLDRFEEAFDSLQRVKEFYERNGKTDTIEYVRILTLFGEIQGRMSRFHDALGIYEELASLTIKLLGHRHPSMGAIYNNLGRMYMCVGRNNLAIENLNKALNIKKDTFVDSDAQLFSSYLNLAELFCSLRECTKARWYIKLASESLDGIPGSKSLKKASLKQAYGWLYLLEGEFDKSEKELKEAMDIRKQALGNRHSSLAWTNCLLAELKHSQGDDILAVTYLKKAEGIMTSKTAFPSQMILAQIGRNYGTILAGLGENEKARDYFLSALTILERAEDCIPDLVVTARINLAGANYRLGATAEAERQFKDVLHILGKGSLESRVAAMNAAYAKFGLGSIACGRKEYQVAIPLFKDIVEALYPICDKDFFCVVLMINAEMGLGDCYLGINDNESGERCFSTALEMARSYSCRESEIQAHMMQYIARTQVAVAKKDLFRALLNGIKLAFLNRELKRYTEKKSASAKMVISILRGHV